MPAGNSPHSFVKKDNYPNNFDKDYNYREGYPLAKLLEEFYNDFIKVRNAY